MKKKSLTIQLNESDRKILDQIKNRSGMTYSAIIAELLQDYSDHIVRDGFLEERLS